METMGQPRTTRRTGLSEFLANSILLRCRDSSTCNRWSNYVGWWDGIQMGWFRSCCRGTLLLLLQKPLAFSSHLLSLWRWDQLVTTLNNRWSVVTLHSFGILIVPGHHVCSSTVNNTILMGDVSVGIIWWWLRFSCTEELAWKESCWQTWQVPLCMALL